MDSCLEMNIYYRQLNKQMLSKRVVDDQNPVFKNCLGEEVSGTVNLGNYRDIFPDTIMQKVIQNFPEMLSRVPFKYDNLLEFDNLNELSVDDKILALSAYELEKEAKYSK